MVFYQCFRCGYSSNDKSKIRLHINRKNTCTNKLNEIKLDECKNAILQGLSYEDYLKSLVNHCKSTVNHCKKHNSPTNDHIISLQSTNIKCEYCKKNYSRIDSLNRHLKTCKEKQKDAEEKSNLLNIVNMLNEQLKEQNEQLKEQKEQNKEQQKQINELIKKAGMTIGTQNIQQNIKILAYNNTDISHLTDKDYLKCLKHSNFCIPHLIEQIHFNPQKPENHNIYISNLKNNYVMIYNGNKWMLNDREESIQNLIDDKESMIEQKLEEWVENGKQYPDIMRKFNRYLEKKENDKVINKVKDEIKLMLFNNRDVVSL